VGCWALITVPASRLRGIRSQGFKLGRPRARCRLVGQFQAPPHAPEAVFEAVDPDALAGIGCLLVGQVAVDTGELSLDEAQAMADILLAVAQLGHVALQAAQDLNHQVLGFRCHVVPLAKACAMQVA